MSFFVHVLTNEKPEFMAQFVHSSRTGAFVANNRFIYRNDAIMMNMKVYSWSVIIWLIFTAFHMELLIADTCVNDNVLICM